MRPSLYVKDEDCRHSFLHGNYVTLCGLKRAELDAIKRFSFSPLYISVHATDPAVRTAMLGNRHAGAIMEQLHELQSHGIKFHTQVVLCPGLNDGKVLEKTIRDLAGFKKGMLSLAVVPVGLTRYHKNKLTPLKPEQAAEVIRAVHVLSDRDCFRTRIRRIFLSDEFYIRAGIKIPPASYYGNYPQTGNGVGCIRLLIEEWKSIKRKLPAIRSAAPHQDTESSCKKPSITVITSHAAYSYIDRVTRELSLTYAGKVSALKVENRFFGSQVTVTGLLTGRDIIRSIRALPVRPRLVVIPGVVFNYRGFTLDGFSLSRIKRTLGIPVWKAEDLAELVRIISKAHGETE
jgi:putative radical SAM enzyme (TIGR03279 family)